MQFFTTLLRLRRRVTKLALLAAVVGGAYGFIVAGESLAGAWRGAATGLILGVFITLFGIFWFAGARAKFSFGVALLVRSAAWLVIIALGLNLSVLVFEGFDQLPVLLGEAFRQAMVFPVLAVVAFNFVLSVNALLGRRNYCYVAAFGWGTRGSVSRLLSRHCGRAPG